MFESESVRVYGNECVFTRLCISALVRVCLCVYTSDLYKCINVQLNIVRIIIMKVIIIIKIIKLIKIIIYY